MGHLTSTFKSTIGRKLVMGFTGLGLLIFVAGHLGENLVLLFGTRSDYNRWTHLLESLGPLLWVIELGLAAFFVAHIISGIQVWSANRRARDSGYRKTAPAGGPSRKSLSSMSMIFTGIVLAVFLVLHVGAFKYGPGVDDGYIQKLDGHDMRDLHRLVVETFKQPAWVIFYCATMILLVFHLRHGFWSAFQSLGAMNPRLTPLTYAVGVFVAVLLGIGFLILPIWLYFNGSVT